MLVAVDVAKYIDELLLSTKIIKYLREFGGIFFIAIFIVL